jgi:hypothetical protein
VRSLITAGSFIEGDGHDSLEVEAMPRKASGTKIGGYLGHRTFEERQQRDHACWRIR